MIRNTLVRNTLVRNTFFLLFFSVIFFSCTSEGGTSTVQGYVFNIIHSDNNYTHIMDTVAAAKEDVFLTIGNSDFYDNDLKTNASGFYKFNNLAEGNYTVFAYNTLPDGTRKEVSVAVDLNGKKTMQADTIYIHTGDAYGTSIVKGKVIVKYYDKKGIASSPSTGEGAGQRVFICNHGEEMPFNDVRAGVNGVFGFEKLKPGTYDIFVVTKGQYTEVERVVTQTIEVTKANAIYDLPLNFTIVVII
jgi:hypothetical protein